LGSVIKIKYIHQNKGVISYHSWERGANENMNGLIRQYFHKKSSFENITDEDIKRVQDKLNALPRKKHKFSSHI
jgi:IS30 family transposase